MKTLSLKLDDLVYEEAEKILEKIRKPRNRYINEAIEYYNKLQKRKLLEKKLKKESELVRSNSKEILDEFEGIEYGS